MMESYMDMSLNGFLSKISSAEPVPGGGSVSAYVALLGIALLKKALAFGLKTDDVSKSEQITQLLSLIDGVQKELILMVDEDAIAFLECLNAPKGRDRFKKAQEAAERIYRLCQQALNLHAKGLYLYRKSLKNDYEGARRLIESACKISWENARYGV